MSAFFFMLSFGHAQNKIKDTVVMFKRIGGSGRNVPPRLTVYSQPVHEPLYDTL